MHPLSLVSLPVTVSVPHTWTLNPPLNPIFLDGPAPDGKVEISLSMLDSMDSHRMDLYVADTLGEAEKHPQRIQVQELTNKNGIKVLERVTYTSGQGDLKDRLTVTTAPSDKITWDIVLFVPYNKKFMPCRFDLFGLTQDQYRDDEQVVESIVDSAEPGRFPAVQ